MTKLIPIYCKGEIVAHTVVDDADFDLLSQWRWRINHNGYAVRSERQHGTCVTFRMHRIIINAPIDLQVDHTDRNRLNNQRNNLRLCTDMENARNRSKYKGTSQYKGVYRRQGDCPHPWCASIQVKQVRIQLGNFSDENEAALAYNDAAIRYFGDFAHLNTIEKVFI
jgi:hypothetical protein